MKLSKDKLKYIISHLSTIEEAWSVIEINDHRSVIVLDGEKVVGTLSDGDIRKAMLVRRLLSTPVHEVMNINFVCITTDQREEVEKIFKKKDIFLLPIVDDKLNLLDIVVK